MSQRPSGRTPTCYSCVKALMTDTDGTDRQTDGRMDGRTAASDNCDSADSQRIDSVTRFDRYRYFHRQKCFLPEKMSFYVDIV